LISHHGAIDVSFGAVALSELWAEVADGAAKELLRREGIRDRNRSDLVRSSAVLLPGTVPAVVLEEALLAILTGVPTVLLPSRRLERLVHTVVRELRARWPELASALWTTPSDNRRTILKEGPEFLRVYGSDETVETIRRDFGRASPGGTQNYGAMRSAAVFELNRHLEDGWERQVLERLRADIFTWGFQGCFSPRDIYAIGGSDHAKRIRGLIERLSAEFERPVAVDDLAADRKAHAIAVMKGAEVSEAGLTLLDWGDSGERAPDGVTTVQLYRRERRSDLIAELMSGEKYSTLGVFPSDDNGRWDEFSESAFRVVPLGRMQRPRFARAHDGMPRVACLLREKVQGQG
jgi:hypothetical protein